MEETHKFYIKWDRIPIEKKSPAKIIQTEVWRSITNIILKGFKIKVPKQAYVENSHEIEFKGTKPQCLERNTNFEQAFTISFGQKIMSSLSQLGKKIKFKGDVEKEIQKKENQGAENVLAKLSAIGIIVYYDVEPLETQ